MNLKKFMSCFLITTFILMAITGCSGGNKPEQVVSQTLDAIQKMDTAKVTEGFVDGNTSTIGLGSEEMTKEEKEMTQLFFKKLSHKIIESKVDGDTATVKTEITNVDFSLIMGDYVSEVMTLSMSNAFAKDGEKLSDEELEKKVQELLETKITDPNAKTVTSTLDLVLSKTDAGWKIKLTDELSNALRGGMANMNGDM